MAQEWYAKCKDCREQYGYSETSRQLDASRGLSRPERCPRCRKLHAREIATLGLSHFDLTPIQAIAPDGLRPGRLGGLERPPRVHELRQTPPAFDYDKFGIKDDHIREYFKLLQARQVTVIVAPTGAGKSTFLPYRLMVPPEGMPPDLWTRRGQIVITQPRIQATRNIPAFVAGDLHGSSLGAGFDVGFRHSGSPATDQRNKLVYLTDGTLINMIVRNELGRLSVIMIDEAHERSLNIDLILGLLRGQLTRYPHLKLIIASATINTDLFINYFGGPERVGFFEFPGKRQYPVDARFRLEEPIPEKQFAGRMPEAVADKVMDILLAMQTGKDPELITLTVEDKPKVARGDILAFLHGEKPIERAVQLISERVDEEPALAGKVDVLPLYTKLPQGRQDAALKPKKDKKRWRVVVSTNVAETSLTVEGIVHVVETGLINESDWDSTTQTSYVTPKLHSQAGCQQRWGRAGRVQPGIAHCLYTKEQFEAFPKHTRPEIVRAPLDQIVLTAKAAGVDDIKNFPWIESPSPAELERAPGYLRQIGALDRDGDLTDHGLELRNFAGEIDVANLMILADRFGCAVEMATLLPMIKLGGYTKLLLWDRSWDAPTKRAVHRIHQGLIEPCLDDLEFYLKLAEAWDGSLFGRRDNRARADWAQCYFVNHNVMKNQVFAERETLLAGLSGHKKESATRPLSFDLLTRLRIVLTYGLSNQVYQLANAPAAGQPMSDAPLYKPYIADPQAHPELVALHQDAVVEISPDSICFGRRTPDHFVCGQRSRMRRRLSPQADPLTIVTASFIVLLRPDWLRLIGRAPIAVARAIAAETRDHDGRLIASTSAARLMIDQNYETGVTYACTLAADGQTVTIGAAVRPALRLRTGRSYEEVEAPEEIEQLDPERELRPGVVEHEAVGRAVVGADEAEESVWTEAFDDESNLPPLPRQPLSIRDSLPGRLVRQVAPIAADGSFSGVVVGFDFSDRAVPYVLLEQPAESPPFVRFAERYAPGEEITVELVAVERYVNDWLAYLVVREVETGLEIVLDPYDYSITGRNFAIEYLRQPGVATRFPVVIEEIHQKARRVRANRLPASEAATARFLGRESKRTVDAAIMEVRDNGLYLWLAPEETADAMPCGAFVHIDRLPQRPDEMSLGRTCRVSAGRRAGKPVRRTLTNVDEVTLAALAKFPWGNKLEWDELNRALSARGPVSYDQRCKLLALSDDPEFRKAINFLFRRSNELDVRVVDMTGLQTLQAHVAEGQPVAGVVVSVSDSGLRVRAEGVEAWIRKDKAVFDPAEELREKYQVGQELPKVMVEAIDMDAGLANLSLLDPQDHPLRDYEPGRVVHATVLHVGDDAAEVELSPGARGRIHKSELAWHRVERATEVVRPGQTVKGLILSIDLDWQRAFLSLRLPETDPLRRFAVNQRHTGRVTGFTSKGDGAFVELVPGVEGFLYKDEIDFQRPPNAQALLREGDLVRVRITEIDPEQRRIRLTARALYESEIWVPESHRRMVIGWKGETIQQIEEATETRLDLTKEGLCLIRGQSEAAVDEARRRVEQIVGRRIVTFTLTPAQRRRLIGGPGGPTINRIQADTGARIDTSRDSNDVQLTAEDGVALQRALAAVRAVVSYHEARVQVPPLMVGKVLGSQWANIRPILAETGADLDVAKDNSGVMTISAQDRQAAERVIATIQYRAGSLNRLSAQDWSLPPVTEVRTETPAGRPVPARDSSPLAGRMESQPVISRPVAPPPAAPTRPVAPPPRQFETRLQLSPAQLTLLVRKSGGFFASLFGGGQSPLEKIQASTGTQIAIVDAAAGLIRIMSPREADVQAAVALIRAAVR